MLVSVWGASGSGKTTIATELAIRQSINSKVILVAGALTHSSIVHNVGIIEKDKSINKVFNKPENLIENTVQHPNHENLYILDLGVNENCLMHTDITESHCTKIIQYASRLYDLVIIDADSSFNNPMTRVALVNSHMVFNIFTESLVNLSFVSSHIILHEKLHFRDKLTFVLNKKIGTIPTPKIKQILTANNITEIPYCFNVYKNSCSGYVTSQKKIGNLSYHKYRKKLDKLNNIINQQKVIK